MANKENRNHVHDLMLRRLTGTATQKEKEELSRRIFCMNDEELLLDIEKAWKEYESDSKMSKEKSLSIINHIFKEDESKTLNKKRHSRQWIYTLSAAASVGILIVVSFFLHYHVKNQIEQTQMVYLEAARIPPGIKVDYTRNHTLPDGSNVVLHGNSVIRFLNDFSGKTREISLEGQAYFDIAPNREKPFIIHTGVIKTTVLGTSFNIKALPGEKGVTVSVKQGKVKVEDNNRVLAILTEKQEFEGRELYHDRVEPKIVYKLATIEESVTDWTKEDLKFDHVLLQEVARTLSKRFGVNIAIANLELANSEIVSFFSGTESLEDILKVLCDINSKTHYVVKDDKNIVISNEESLVK
jgi:ferric-dicitrate binding protein FerR (iron transport regulator)